PVLPPQCHHRLPTRRSSDLVELSPQRDWVSLNYAHALMLSGQPDAARTIYRELDAAPGDAGGLRRQMRDDFAVHLPSQTAGITRDRKSTRLNSSHDQISYAV